MLNDIFKVLIFARGMTRMSQCFRRTVPSGIKDTVSASAALQRRCVSFQLKYITAGHHLLRFALLPDHFGQAKVAEAYKNGREDENTASQPNKVDSFLPGRSVAL